MITPVSERGFTLIEVLAALLIFSLSIVGLTHSGTQSAQAAIYLEQKVLASIVADNQLSLARASKELSPGVKNGNAVQMGQAFLYSVETEATDVAGLLKIVVTVERNNSGRTVRADGAQTLVTRTAFKAPL